MQEIVFILILSESFFKNSKFHLCCDHSIEGIFCGFDLASASWKIWILSKRSFQGDVIIYEKVDHPGIDAYMPPVTSEGVNVNDSAYSQSHNA